jgi:hypothetical protein
VTDRRRPKLDPNRRLVRLVERLGRSRQYVTLSDIEAAARRPSARLPAEGLTALVEEAVQETLLLKDLRTFFDRRSGALSNHWVYRVNPRHPIAADLLADGDL